MWCLSLLVIIPALVATCQCQTEPVVTLSHNGQLQGKTITWDGQRVDLFSGVRYAKAPVGDLRFKKPEEPDSWVGVRSATSTGNYCMQIDPFTQNAAGSEDCLFLHITVPGGVQTAALKPVMVYIHGGGYTVGQGELFLGVPLAVHGDVIVVTINYRLSMLGFLTNDQGGQGNFGLWDQRKALEWVKNNIGVFGGDADKVTIFGESAGAGSVSSQVMSQQTEGLFRRAIAQSGSMYPDWGWFKTDNLVYEIDLEVRRATGCCNSTKSIYECFDGMTTEQVSAVETTLQGRFITTPIWFPSADNDFFASTISDENYAFANEVDLLAGFNGQEGGLILYMTLAFVSNNVSAVEGVGASLVDSSLTDICTRWNPGTVESCVNFIKETYGLDDAADDQERGLRLTSAYGELSFNSDALRMLQAHAPSSKSTYAYYLTELYNPPAESQNWPLPTWAKQSADHGDDLPFVWGYIYAKENLSALIDAYGITDESVKTYIRSAFKGPSNSDRNLTDLMMTAWTNFAKSGNPNTPVDLGSDADTWPSFTTSTQQFMNLNSSGATPIDAPFKDRLNSVIANLFASRTAQIPEAARPDEPDPQCRKIVSEEGSNEEECKKFSNINGSERTMFVSMALVCILLLLHCISTV